MSELEVAIAQQEEMWALYEEFSVSLDQLGSEDWISFRWSAGRGGGPREVVSFPESHMHPPGKRLPGIGG